MYRQIVIDPEDRKFQCILWRNSVSDPIHIFELNTVTYGLSSSPFQALRTMQQLATDEGANYPLAAHTLLHDVFVDDIVTGADTVGDAQELKTRLVALLGAGGFQLHKWCSNNGNVVGTHDTVQADMKFDITESVKVLGIHWTPSKDEFCYKVKVPTVPNTKRGILSFIVRLYDPCGWLAPVITASKILLQVLWTKGLGWDDQVDEEILSEWESFTAVLPLLSRVRIPQFIPLQELDVQFHGFCDASEKAYAAVMYVRDDSRSHSTKRRWIPPSTVRRDALSQENKNDLIFRKVRGILNKLTPEKFQKLSDDLLQTELNSSVILKGVILLIFEKALDEPKYSSMYAQLCKRLSEEAPNFEPPSSPCCTFRLLLLNKCRAEFENRSKATEAFEQRDGPLAPEEEERRQLAKRKMLGNIKFIGELGKLEILAEGILHRCIQQLLDKKKKGSSKDTAEDLECLSQIMRTCGRILDSEKGKKLMNQYFERMQMLADSVELPLRIRFMLRDVIELRRDRWVPRKATSTEGPMPIHQMREEEQGRRGGYHQHHQQHQHHRAELFGPGLKRSGLEDVLGTLPLSGPSLAPSMPPSFGSNGYQPGGFRQNRQQNFYSGGSNRQNFSQNHGKTNHNINSSQQQNFTASSGTGKDLPPRFKKLAHQVGQAALEEEVSLRPAANTMVFKQPGAKQSLLSAGRPGSVTLGDPLPQLKPGPSLPLLKEPPILIKQASLDKNKAGRRDKGPSKEEVLRKAEGLLEEYLSSSRLQDAVSAYREQKVPDKFARPVLLAMMSATLDRSDADRDLASALMVELRKEGLVSPAHFLEAYRDLVAQAADKEQEVPRVYSHVAGLAAAAVGKELVSLGEVAEPTESGAHYPLFLLTLQQLHRLLGRAPLTQMFLDSKVNLLNQLPEADRTKERLAEILEERGLTFLFPLLRIQAELWKQLLADPNPTQFYKWIKENLDPAHHSDPPFISALVTVLLKYITQESTLAEGVDCSAAPEKALQEKEKALLERYKPVLQAFLHERTDLQVTAVYSLQVFCFGLHFPKGMLLRWFVNLYDLEIVEEEAFLKWKEDITDDYPGKGKALFQVNQWLTWLAEAESEEEDEEGDI